MTCMATPRPDLPVYRSILSPLMLFERSLLAEGTVTTIALPHSWCNYGEVISTFKERTGLEENYYNILSMDLPHIELYVRPGRDIARLVEVAALTHALKQMGHDPARDFNDRLIAFMAEGGGWGRMNVQQVCDRFTVPVDEGVARLKAAGIEATAFSMKTPP